MLLRGTDFSCHAVRRGTPTTARGRVRLPSLVAAAQLLFLVTSSDGSRAACTVRPTAQRGKFEQFCGAVPLSVNEDETTFLHQD